MQPDIPQSPRGSGPTNFLSNAVVNYQRQTADVAEMTSTQITSILIIYAGGTIGMMKDPQHGYCPVPGHLHSALAARPDFHDPNFELAEYANLAASRCARSAHSDDLHKQPHKQPHPQLHPALITPASVHNKRMMYWILEYDQLLDSCDMTMTDWIRIASDIGRHYRQYDAFIVLHGTDTMAYTASALSFLLENLGKTVIITGSQIPLSELRSDASDNLLGALTIAGHYVIPEVGLYFHNRLLRGNRATKQKALNLDAFNSPNLKPLARVGVNIDVDWREVLKPVELAALRVHDTLDPNVAILRLFPGITGATIRAFLQSPLRGVVLETFGAGNAPSNQPDLLAALAEAVARGVIIVNCTQCLAGTVSDLYATGRALYNVGVIPGHDMTTEAALTKLSYLLSKTTGVDGDSARSDMSALGGDRTHDYALDTHNSALGTHDSALGTHDHALGKYRTQMMLASLRGELTVPSLAVAQPSTGRSPLAALFHTIPQSTANDRRVFESLLSPTLVSLAAARGDLVALRGFLSRSATGGHQPFSRIDFTGGTPLHAAVRARQPAAVEWLLRHGSSIHQRDSQQHTPLLLAISLLSVSERGGRRDGRDGRCAPASPQADPLVAIIELLRVTGGTVDDSDLVARRLLFHAVIAGDLDVVEGLLAAGLDPHVRDRHQRSIRDLLPQCPLPGEVDALLVRFERDGDKCAAETDGSE